MISASRSGATTVLSRPTLASFYLLTLLGVPPRARALSPQSSGAPSAEQQPAQNPTKKNSASTASDSAASKTNSPKAHRVFTNDDLSPGSDIPIAPGARRRLKQLNRCARTCFNDVKKQAISFGYITAFPRSTREEMDDRLANDIQELQNDLKWQSLLLELISAHVDYCATRQKSPPLDNSPSHTPTRAEILEEEARASQPRQAPTSNYGAAGSAVMSYRFSSRPDPLKASLMVHQYMDEVHRDCPLSQSTADTDDDQDP
jgi:hypothetical protein